MPDFCFVLIRIQMGLSSLVKSSLHSLEKDFLKIFFRPHFAKKGLVCLKVKEVIVVTIATVVIVVTVVTTLTIVTVRTVVMKIFFYCNFFHQWIFVHYFFLRKTFFTEICFCILINISKNIPTNNFFHNFFYIFFSSSPKSYLNTNKTKVHPYNKKKLPLTIQLFFLQFFFSPEKETIGT